MKLNFHGERILAVMAHPDDAELLCAGTLMRAREDGAAVGIAYLCMGDKGQPPKPIPDLAKVRKDEAIAVAQMIGAELFAGVFPDGALFDNEQTRMHLLRVVRTFRPTLILTHALEDYHADHRACGAIAEAVSWFAASKGYTTDGLDSLHHQPALWWTDCLGMTGFNPTIYVDVSSFGDLKERLLAAHLSQLSRTDDKEYHPLHSLMTEQMSTRGFEAGIAAAEVFRPYLTMKRTRAW